MTRLRRSALVLAIAAASGTAASAAAPPHYDSHAMRRCFGSRADVVQSVMPLPRDVAPLSVALRRHVLFVSFSATLPIESQTVAVLVFGRDEMDARAHAELILAAAMANQALPRPSLTASSGNVAFFTMGRLTDSIAGDMRTCFLRAAQAGAARFVV